MAPRLERRDALGRVLGSDRGAGGGGTRGGGVMRVVVELAPGVALPAASYDLNIFRKPSISSMRASSNSISSRRFLMRASVSVLSVSAALSTSAVMCAPSFSAPDMGQIASCGGGTLRQFESANRERRLWVAIMPDAGYYAPDSECHQKCSCSSKRERKRESRSSGQEADFEGA